MARRGPLDPDHFAGGRNLTRGGGTPGEGLLDLLDDLRAVADSLEASMEDALRLYVDTVNGDDANDGTSWDQAMRTEAVLARVPRFGWTYLYVRGNLSLTDEPLPYVQYFGCLRIIGADDWTEVAAGTVTSYTSSGGRFESDLWDLDLGVYSKADATDQAYFLEVEDDGGKVRTRKVLEYNYGASGKYDVERPGSQTISGGNPCRLVRPTTTITIADRVSATYDILGSVCIVGCRVVGSSAVYPIRHVGLSACEVDLSAATYAAIMGKSATIGTLTNTEAAHGTDFYVSMPLAAVEGTYLEGKEGSTSRYPGCYFKMKSTGEMVFSSAMRNQWLAMYSVFNGGKVQFLAGLLYCNVQDCRGVDTDLEVANGAEVYAQHVHFPDGILKVYSDGRFWHWSATVNTVGSVDLHKGTIYGWGTSTIDLVRSAAHDSIAVAQGVDGFIEDTKFTGGYSLATPASPKPMVKLEGRAANLQLALATHNRGAGALVLEDTGALIGYGATATGINSNAGGWGLEVRDKALADLPASHALTGNGGSETRVYLGTLGLTAYPGSGSRKNDLPADPAGTEELAVVSVR